MQKRRFGKLNWQVSEIGFGAWAIGGDMWGPQSDKESLAALNKAVDGGINFIDTAQGYGKGHSEELIGRFLKSRSEELYIATKVPPMSGTPWPPPDNFEPDVSYPGKYIIEECEKSLKRLNRDYIDIYQFHTWVDSFNVRGEWLEAMHKLKSAGKIRAVGVSVHDTTPDSVIGALALNEVDSVQVIYNIFEQYPEYNLLPVCEKLGIGVIVRVPFDEGALTGKFTENTKFPEGDVRRHYFRKGNLKAVIRKVEEIEKVKEKHHPGMPMPEYALRFALSHPAVSTVIPGIRNTKQAEMNSVASDGNLLGEEEKKELKRFYWRKDFWNRTV